MRTTTTGSTARRWAAAGGTAAAIGVYCLALAVPSVDAAKPARTAAAPHASATGHGAGNGNGNGSARTGGSGGGNGGGSVTTGSGHGAGNGNGNGSGAGNGGGSAGGNGNGRGPQNGVQIPVLPVTAPAVAATLPRVTNTLGAAVAGLTGNGSSASAIIGQPSFVASNAATATISSAVTAVRGTNPISISIGVTTATPGSTSSAAARGATRRPANGAGNVVTPALIVPTAVIPVVASGPAHALTSGVVGPALLVALLCMAGGAFGMGLLVRRR